METVEVYEKLERIKRTIRDELMVYSYNEYHMPDHGNILLRNKQDPNEIQLHDELYGIFDKLEDVCNRLSYLKRPITGSGFLFKNELGRFELPDGFYFTAGDTLEVLIQEEDHVHWVLTQMKHNGEDYRLSYRNMDPDGLMARYRR